MLIISSLNIVLATEFTGNLVGAKDLSAIACDKSGNCLLGSDEGVQVMALKKVGTNYKMTQLISLSTSVKEMDIESIAYSGNSYYVMGSHSMSKKGCNKQESRFLLYKLDINEVSGLAKYPLDARTKIPTGGLSKVSLQEFLRTDADVGPYFEKCLQDSGLNIEGSTIKKGYLYLGLRAPNVDGKSPIIKIALNSIFGSKAKEDDDQRVIDRTVTWVDVGANNVGVREIKAIKDGFALITGSSVPKQKAPYQLRFWDGKSTSSILWISDLKSLKQGSSKALIASKLTKKAKPEGLAILSENDKTVEVLLVSDKVRGGAPRVFSITKKLEGATSSSEGSWLSRGLGGIGKYFSKE